MRGRPRGSADRKRIHPNNIPGWNRDGISVPAWLWRRPRTDLGYKAKVVYATMLQHWDNQAGCVRVTQGDLAARVEDGITVRTLYNHLRTLEVIGLIGVRHAGLGQPNEYDIYDHPWMWETPVIGGHSRKKLADQDRKKLSDQGSP